MQGVEPPLTPSVCAEFFTQYSVTFLSRTQVSGGVLWVLLSVCARIHAAFCANGALLRC